MQGTHNAIEDPRNEHVKIYINGEFFPRQEAKISVFDSGYLVGDGVWEGLRLHHNTLVFFKDHCDRLCQSAKVVGIPVLFSRKELEEKIMSTIAINEMRLCSAICMQKLLLWARRPQAERQRGDC